MMADKLPKSELIHIILILLFSVKAYATGKTAIDTIEPTPKLIEDLPLVATLDSLTNIFYFNSTSFPENTNELNVYGFSADSIPVYPDSVYEARLEMLNIETPLELTFNKIIKNYIHLYAVRKRELTERVLGLAKLYFPYIEKQLDLFNMPLEIKYLAIVESALIPTAGSKAGAKGMWQFMYETGKMYDLQVNSFIDDRYDPFKSTVAACRHLSDLYAIYGDWFLAMAAYNSGAGVVNRAIRRVGGIKNYWAIWPFLPHETRDYVPAFIAVNYIMNFAAEHNLYPKNPEISYQEIDTVTVHDVLSFDQLSELFNIPVKELQFLNPRYKLGVIPATRDKKHTLHLKKDYISLYLNNQDTLYKFRTRKGIERENLLAQIKKAKDRNIHIVKSGENLGLIAKKYRCYVNQLKRWNNLHSNTIFPGQKLIVYGQGVWQENRNTSDNTQKKHYHIVTQGESLGLIAQKYQCSIAELKKWNNLKDHIIYPNQKLSVYNPEI